MSAYVVSWSIDIEDVDSPEDAAVAALEIQRDPESSATIFEVQEVKRRWQFRNCERRVLLGEKVEVYL